MRALCDALGNPERAYRTLHVVGTNGKTSVTLICAALLEEAGLRTGACVSPHVRCWRERTRIAGTTIGPEPFAAAVGEVARAIEGLELDPGLGPVTQFEAQVAVSLLAFRSAGVEAAVIEAGLGGRLDATNVIASEATALTSVAIDHTEWLGETVDEIAAEKLAVLEPGTTLIVGALEPAVAEIAAAHAGRVGAELRAAAGPADAAVGVAGTGALRAPYQRRNAAVAIALAEVLVGRQRPERVRAVLDGLPIEGRAELIEGEVGEPPVIADVAHNAEGAAALVEALAELAPGRARVGCVSLLAEKDAAGIATALAPTLDHVVCTAADPGPGMGRPGAEALSAGALAAHFERAGVEAEAIADPGAAIERAVRLAGDRSGVAICAGSNYLLGHLWTRKRDQSSST